MTREEFSNQLRQLRDASNTPLRTLCSALNALPNTVYRIEKGANNYSVKKAIIYATTVNAEIVAKHPERKDTVLISTEIATDFLITARGDGSIYQVAKDNGYSQMGLSKTESGTTALSIDMLLKLSEYYGYQIALKPK